MKRDYPAAHSMDTTWYAIDQQGQVASFDTGEAGCVPTSCGDTEALDLIETLMSVPPGSGVELYVDDLVKEADGKILMNTHDGWEERSLEQLNIIYCVLVWLKDDSMLRDVDPKNASEFHRAPVETDVFAYADSPRRKDLRAFVQQGVLNRAWVNFLVEPSRFGLYEFEHGAAFDNWISGPYVKTSNPVSAMDLSKLPIEIREDIAKFRFSRVDFKQDITVDPREETNDYHDWGSQKVMIDGRIEEDDRE